MLWQKLGKD